MTRCPCSTENELENRTPPDIPLHKYCCPSATDRATINPTLQPHAKLKTNILIQQFLVESVDALDGEKADLLGVLADYADLHAGDSDRDRLDVGEHLLAVRGIASEMAVALVLLGRRVHQWRIGRFHAQRHGSTGQIELILKDQLMDHFRRELSGSFQIEKSRAKCVLQSTKVSKPTANSKLRTIW